MRLIIPQNVVKTVAVAVALVGVLVVVVVVVAVVVAVVVVVVVVVAVVVAIHDSNVDPCAPPHRQSPTPNAVASTRQSTKTDNGQCNNESRNASVGDPAAAMIYR